MARQSAKDTISFLPTTRSDMKKRGWDSLDIIIVSGDAYVDHPGFAAAVLGRYLEASGFRVGIISQPAWDTPVDFTKLGKPNLFFAISSGNLDSMVNHYTAAKKIRRDDAFSPEGRAGNRPNRACIVYSNKVHEAYPDVPVVIGGIEASLRRFAQYDYWSDKVRQSILADTPADILIYGMGETQILEVANRLKNGVPVSDINDIAGTAVKVPVKVWRENPEWHDDYIEIPDFNTVSKDKEAFAKAFALYSNEQDPIRGKAV
ncbi:MAG: YgiQ family radical SAM protein, partial [Methanosarcinales archaeon]|nr:YgiQ family radical SAM protein [Methanosarcinales archaeon]